MNSIKLFARTSIIVAGLVLGGGQSMAQVPNNLSYQGYLADSGGSAVDATVGVEFALYADDTGGLPLWSDDQTITPSEGIFSVILGNPSNPLPDGLFDAPLFLGITIEGDVEMSPRTALTSSAFAHHAAETDTVGGMTASELNQAAAVSALAADVSAAQADVDQVQTELTVVENTLPLLQRRVSGTCSSGSSIRVIDSNGAVTCETDDAGPWQFDGDAYLAVGTRVGLGTTAPAASLQIDAPADTDPFRARVQSSTKLRVHTNGSVSAGTSSAGPENGLHVAGRIGAGTSTPAARGSFTDSNWQMSLDNNDTGGGEWFLGSSADAWAAGGGKFVLAPSASSVNPAMVVDANRDVGIGTIDPLAKLHIVGGTDVTAVGGGYITLGNLTSSNVAIDNNEIMGRNNGAAGILALNAEGGEVTVNSGGSRDNDSLDIRGRVNFDNGGNGGMRITATDSSPTNALFESTQFEEGLVGWSGRPFWRVYSREFYASAPAEYRTYSDRSVKKNVATIENALETIMQLEGVTYELKDHPFDDRKRTRSEKEQFDREHQLGFVAQDLEMVLPQLVSEDEDSGLKTVGYMGVIPVLVEALKEQQRQIDAQWEEIERLREQLN